MNASVRILAAGLVVACILAGWAVGSIGAISPLWALVAAGALLVALPFVVAVAQRRFDIFEPVYLFAIAYLVIFVLRPAFDLSREGGLPLQLGYPLAPTYGFALFLAVVGGACFYAGYYLKLGRRLANRLPLPESGLDAPALHAFVLVAVTFSICLYGLFLATTGGRAVLSAMLSGRNPQTSAAFASASGYLYDAPLWLGSLGVLLLGIAERWRSTLGVLGFALVGLSQLTTFSTGARSWVLPFAAMVVLLRYLRQGRRPSARLTALTIVLVFILGITVPREHRNTADRQGSFAETAAQSFLHPGESVRQFFEGDDTAMVGNLAIERQFVPRALGYQWGRTYVEAITRPIPRHLWPGKPAAGETRLNQLIWPEFAKKHIGFAFSLFGEPYLNFGVVGVAAFGLVFGLYWRTLYAWFVRAPRNLTVLVFFALNWPFLFVYFRGGVSVVYHRHAIALAPTLAAIMFARVKLARGRAGQLQPLAAAE